MNAKWKGQPEIIGTARTIDSEGNESYLGDKIIGLSVVASKEHPVGVVQLDVRGFTGSKNLMIDLELPEVVSALSLATLNASKD